MQTYGGAVTTAAVAGDEPFLSTVGLQPAMNKQAPVTSKNDLVRLPSGMP